MLHHMATILVCYGGHFESKMATKIQKSSDLGKIWFPSRSWVLRIDNRRRFWNWEPWGGVMSAIALQWQF